MIKKLIKNQIKKTKMFKSLEEENAVLARKITDLNNQLNTKTTENDNLNNQVTCFINSREDIQKNIAVIKTENKHLKKQYKAYKELQSKKFNTLNSENNKIKTDNEVLRSENKNLKVLNDKINMYIANLKIDNDNLNLHMNNIEKSNLKMLDDINKTINSYVDNDPSDSYNVDLDHPPYIMKILQTFKENNELFTLWVSDDDELPELQQLSLKSMILTGHNVTLYTYDELKNVPEGVKVVDGNKIVDRSDIFQYSEGFNKGSYAGFSDLFRMKCLLETGKSWFDCDILAIKNINQINYSGPIITSEYTRDGIVHPNVGFLRLDKGDPLLKELSDHIYRVKDSAKHGEIGPRLIKSKMDAKFQEYYDYMVNPNFIASINYFNYLDFLKPSEDMVPKLKFDEIWGFHIWNAMFNEYGRDHEISREGFYHDLRKIIYESSNERDYQSRIKQLIDQNG